MHSKLASWQLTLSAHFERLKEQREPSHPAFVLEHGLSEESIASLKKDIRLSILSGPPTALHYLPWLVYATELGYRYSGSEYWQTFEEETPGWLDKGSRHWLRERFRRFARTYNGVEPSGPWAENFSIICWPITHAILPRDHQVKLTYLLADLRSELRPDVVESAERLGELLHRSANAGSERFRGFLEQHRLVGRIARALLANTRSSRPLIYPPTLDRILADLRKIEPAAQRSLERTREEVVKLAHRHKNIGGVATIPPQSPKTLATPELRLHEASPGSDVWQVVLHFPWIQNWRDAAPDVHELFASNRLRIAGTTTPLARGRLLYPGQCVVLKKLAPPGNPLLTLESGESVLGNNWRSDLMRFDDVGRIFKLGQDGVGREVISRKVRPGGKYLLLATTTGTQERSYLHSVQVACEGLGGWLVTVPNSKSANGWTEFEELWKLQLARQIWISPVGAPPIAWNGDSEATFLASESPRFAIRANDALSPLSLRVDNGMRCEFFYEGLPALLLIELAPMGVGRHTIEVKGFVDALGYEADFGTVNVSIISDHEFDQIRLSRRPLVGYKVPPAATLEQLLENSCFFEIFGPSGSMLDCRARLHSSIGGRQAKTVSLPRLEIPVEHHKWEKLTSRLTDLGDALEDIVHCELEFAEPTLGKLTAYFERSYLPLRWVASRSGSRYTLYLRNEADSAPGIDAFQREFTAPTGGGPIQLDDRQSICTEQGGLFEARSGSHRTAIVVPPTIVAALSQLAPAIPRTQFEASLPRAFRILEAAKAWSDSRVVGGPVGLIHRQTVLRALASDLAVALGGPPVNTLEDLIARRQVKDRAVLDVSRRQEERRLVSSILRDAPRYLEQLPATRATMLRELIGRCYPRNRFQPVLEVGRRITASALENELEQIILVGLQLSSGYFESVTVASKITKQRLEYLSDLGRPIVLAARLTVKAVAEEAGPQALVAGRCYAGWSWT